MLLKRFSLHVFTSNIATIPSRALFEPKISFFDARHLTHKCVVLPCCTPELFLLFSISQRYEVMTGLNFPSFRETKTPFFSTQALKGPNIFYIATSKIFISFPFHSFVMSVVACLTTGRQRLYHKQT